MLVHQRVHSIFVSQDSSNLHGQWLLVTWVPWRLSIAQVSFHAKVTLVSAPHMDAAQDWFPRCGMQQVVSIIGLVWGNDG